MLIGERLKARREHKKMSQGDIERRTGLLRCYISRVENGHTVPAIETLEKMARAMEIPMYQLFYAAKSLQPRNFRRPMTAVGAVLAAMLEHSTNSAACLVEPVNPTANRCW
jgi:transcriptional regulator with XRE-family HTH domain